jgi:hypothetical protein
MKEDAVLGLAIEDPGSTMAGINSDDFCLKKR